MRVYLHAGHFKTGTTAFQQLLAREREVLGNAGIYVPHMPQQDNHGHALIKAIRDPASASELSDELEQAARQGCTSCLLSAEVVSHFDAQEMDALARLLMSFQTTFVLVLRPWQPFLLSRYSQNVRRCDWLGFSDYLHRLAEVGDRHPDANVSVIVESALTRFDEVVVIPYGPDAAAHCILPRAGLSHGQVATMLGRQARANASPSPVFVAALRLVNQLVGESLGLVPDQKLTQPLDRRRPIRLLDLENGLQRWCETCPDQWGLLRALIEERAGRVDWSPVSAGLARWQRRLNRALSATAIGRAGGPVRSLLSPHVDVADLTVAGLDDLPVDLRADLLHVARDYLDRQGRL